MQRQKWFTQTPKLDTNSFKQILGQLYEYGQGPKPILSTPEASAKFDDSYMGYSVTTGDFAGQGIQGVAVGVPRGSNLKGLVRTD